MHLSPKRYFPNQATDLAPGDRVYLDVNLWKSRINKHIQDILKGQPPTFQNCDGGLYVGSSGIAYMLYYLSQSNILEDQKDVSIQS